MKLISIFLAATLAIAAAKPYGIKGGYDRDNDRLVQSHIPVTDDLNSDRLELSQSRKVGRPTYGGEPSLVEPIGSGYGRERESIIQGRPIGGGHSDVIVGRPISGGLGQGHHGGHSDIIVGRPIHGGHSDIIVGKPIGGGHGDIIVARPIGGHGHSSRLETELGGHHGIHRAQQIGGIKSGQHQIGY